MRRSSRLLFVAVALCSALAFAAPAALAAKPRVEVLSDGQGAILANGSLKAEVTVKLTRGRPATVSVKGASSTFDEPRFAALTESRSLSFRRSGSKTVKLALRPGARSEIRSCEGRTLRVSAGSAAGRPRWSATPPRVSRSRSTSPAPRSATSSASRAARSACCPSPTTSTPPRTPSSNTGRRIDFKSDAMPANSSDVHIDPPPTREPTGSAPGRRSSCGCRVSTTPAGAGQHQRGPDQPPGPIHRPQHPVVVIDTATGKRWPIWVEIDSNASTPDETALLIHPAKNFAAKHRYVVALRNLKDAPGKTIAAPEGFRYYRDDLPSGKAAINEQRARFERVFKDLRSAGIDRSNLYLAWDFTVGSDQNIASRMLHIRDDAFAQLGDTDLADGVVTGHRAVVQRHRGRPRPRHPDACRRAG